MTVIYSEDVNAEKLALEEHVPAAVALLGWEGTLVGPLWIAGRRVSTVVSLIGPVHETRQTAGWGPVVDRLSVEALSAMPGLGPLPPVAVHMVGVVSTVKHLSTARHSVFPLSTMCPAAVLMRRARRAEMCVPEQRGLLGRLGVVAVDDQESVDVLREPLHPHTYPTQYEVYRRWVLEVMYERALVALAQVGDR